MIIDILVDFTEASESRPRRRQMRRHATVIHRNADDGSDVARLNRADMKHKPNTSVTKRRWQICKMRNAFLAIIVIVT